MDQNCFEEHINDFVHSKNMFCQQLIDLWKVKDNARVVRWQKNWAKQEHKAHASRYMKLNDSKFKKAMHATLWKKHNKELEENHAIMNRNE